MKVYPNLIQDASAILPAVLLQVSLVAIVLFVLIQLLLSLVPNANAFLRSLILSLGMLSLLIAFPVSFSLWKSGNTVADSIRFSATEVSESISLVKTESTAERPKPSDSKDNSTKWEDSQIQDSRHSWIVAIYVIGVLGMSTRFVLGFFYQRKLLRKGRPVESPEHIARVGAICRRFQWKQIPEIIVIDQAVSPFVTGILRPVIVFPVAMLSSLSPRDIDLILTHEVAHLKRRDHWMIAIQRCVEMLLFFHPLVWILSRQLEHERENACDDFVVNSGYSATSYANLLIQISNYQSSGAAASLAASGRPSTLRLRLSRLLQMESSGAHRHSSLNGKGIAAVGSAIIVATALGLATNSFAAPAKPVDQKTAVEQNRKLVEERFANDRDRFDNQEFRIIEEEYQRVNELRKTKEFREEVEAFVKRYKRSNRAGCLFLYLARSVELPEREEFLERAIDDYGDCFYGDGTQVAPYGMLNLALLYDYLGEEEKSEEMLDALVAKYPNATDHSQTLIRERVKAMKNPPTVTKTEPANENKNVDPGLSELRFHFSEPMSPGGRSIVGGGETFPEIVGEIRWENPKTVIVPVKLRPNQEYWLSLNSKKFQNFRSQKGVSSVPYPISFKTGEARATVDTLGLLRTPPG